MSLAVTISLCTTVVFASHPSDVEQTSIKEISMTDAQGLKRIVDSAAKQFFANPKVIGLSLGIIQGEKTKTFDYGFTMKGGHVRANRHTPYPIASITKIFAGTLLAQAVIEKRVKLNDDPRTCLAEAFPNLEFQGESLQLWQLLNQTSGLPRDFPEATTRNPNALSDYTAQDFLKELHTATLSRKPGVSFSYSNVAAQLLGLVLERVYGKSFEQLVATKIAGPLSMSDTRVTQSQPVMNRMPRGFGPQGSFLPECSVRLPAAACLSSSTSDMLKYTKWHMAEKDKAVKLSHQPAGTTEWSGDGSFTVGLNWQIFNSPGKRWIFQDGYIPGFHSLCAFSPELHLGIVLLVNEEMSTEPTRLSPLANQILKAIDSRAGGLK